MKTFLIAVTFLLSASLFSQSVSESDLDRISNELLDSLLNERISTDGKYVRNDNCLFGVEEDRSLSCFYLGGSLNWVSDVNGDSIPDVVIRIEDQGLGGGGNMYGYDYAFVTLSGDKRIHEKYVLFGGGKFSYAHLSIDSISNGRIYATYQQNPYAYFEINDFEPDSLACEFYLENGKLNEIHYGNCAMSEMNKRIFRNDLAFKIDRSLQLDSEFNDEQIETLFLDDSTHYVATLSGCANMELHFSHSFAYAASLQTSKTLVKSTWIEHLDFLITSTRFPSLLSEVREQLSKRSHQLFKLSDYSGFHESFVLKNNWTCHLYLSGDSEQYNYVTVILRDETSEKLEFWEQLKQKFE